MANITPRRNKDGEIISYQIRIFRGRNADGTRLKDYMMTWRPTPGMTKRQIFFKVTLLQVIKRVIPPMGNEFMTLIKDTALANIIATKEIIMMSKEFINRGLIWPLFSTALFFLVFCGVLTLLFGWLERKMDYFRV